MSNENNSQAPELSWTDRRLWEAGAYIPLELNKQVLDALRSVAVESGYYDSDVSLKELSVRFPTQTIKSEDGRKIPEYRMILKGWFEAYDDLPEVLQKYAKTNEKYKGKIDFTGTDEAIYINVGCKNLRLLLDLLMESFIKKRVPEIDINLAKIMDEAAPKGLNYKAGSKNWHTQAELNGMNPPMSCDDEYYKIGKFSPNLPIK